MAFSGITEANVYGVRVPGAEGAAGMAAILPNGRLDIAALRAHLAQIAVRRVRGSRSGRLGRDPRGKGHSRTRHQNQCGQAESTGARE